MKRLIPLIALAALTACNQNTQPDVVETRAPDPNAAALANAAPVELPPAIRAQKTYRCTDQSLVYVNWFVGDKTANVRTEQNGLPTILTSTAESGGGSPWASADGATTLSGIDTAITYTAAGKALSCKG